MRLTWKLIIIMMVIILPMVAGSVSVQWSTDNSTWNEMTHIDENNNATYVNNLLPNTLYYFRIQSPSGASSWIYTSGKTIGEDTMASFSIALFFMILTFVGYYLAFSNYQFTQHQFSNNIMKKCMMIFSTFMLALTTTVLATIADYSGLPLTSILFTILNMINWTCYIMMIFLFFTTIISSLNLYKDTNNEKRMGR